MGFCGDSIDDFLGDVHCEYELDGASLLAISSSVHFGERSRAQELLFIEFNIRWTNDKSVIHR